MSFQSLDDIYDDYELLEPDDRYRLLIDLGRALEVLEIEGDPDFEEIKQAYRRLAKASHPDVAGDDADAAKRFVGIQAAYEVLRKAEERRSALSP